MRVSILGSGSWGTALAILLARNGHEVVLVSRNAAEVQDIQVHRENRRYLPGMLVPENVTVERFPVIPVTALTIVAVPSGAVREISNYLPEQEQLILLAAKGLDAQTGELMTQIVSKSRPSARVGALTGPNLAGEIAKGIPTAAIAAFESDEDAEIVRSAFACRTFRVYKSGDVVGAELAGALKNVLAIAAGMSDGLGFGDNTKGALLARGLREMIALGSAMGARHETFIGIAGVGDLFATAASVLSRNYRLGKALGCGESLELAMSALGQVAEGVATSEAAMLLAEKHQVSMPVFKATNAVIRGVLAPSAGVGLLMERTTPYEGLTF
jgi:glycerol-3-phosphate dehydrogenase (NAD(P)+)